MATDSFVVESVDGSATAVVTVSINGTFDVPDPDVGVSLDDGVLNIVGTAGPDDIDVTRGENSRFVGLWWHWLKPWHWEVGR